ncbi:hypothetical protein PVBG_01343 [Plasmodium vivax Brazil I]|uniref:Variable surface protein Vir21 n=1 Tax=Plasmodium vivax (strain Brazil I) TaxID=1033975 RepID=A0A0J9VGS0_PLAV1|nr:hypothetical protein PVBG_01343 [Plasmodium vivax Brazil I]
MEIKYLPQKLVFVYLYIYIFRIQDNILTKSHLYDFYKLLESHNTIHTTVNCDFPNYNPIEDKGAICSLWGKVKKILDKWKESYANYKKLHPNKSCEYFNYWLYSKLKEINSPELKISLLYNKWFDLVYNKSNEQMCNSKKYNGLSAEELHNKKRLYDFLEYYYSIRDMLVKADSTKKKEYCNYIENIFKLYKGMDKKNISPKYIEEISYFEKIFLHNRNELAFISNECPGKCLHLVFNKIHKNICPKEIEELKVSSTKPNSCSVTSMDTVDRSDKNLEYVF